MELEELHKMGKELELWLRMRVHPVAVKLLKNKEETPEGAIIPTRDWKHKYSLCQTFSRSQDGHEETIAMFKEDHWCFEPVIGLGLTERITEFLEGHPHVKRVYYPFLKSHRHYEVAQEQMTGGGGVVTFEIKGNLNTAKAFLDALKLCYIGPSFGGVETLITHPALVSYYEYSRKDRYALGITDTLFRLAVGIEDVEDIIGDLERGLQA